MKRFLLKQGWHAVRKLALLAISLPMVCGGWAPALADYYPTEGLVSYWSFGDPSDMGRDDWAENDGVNHGATGETGIQGGCAKLDGNQDYIEIPYDSSIDVHGWSEGSVALWFKPFSPSSGTQVLMSDVMYDESNNPDKNGIYLGVRKERDVNWSWRDGSDPDERYTGADGNLEANSWYHLALVYTAASGAKFYLNGELVGEDYEPDDFGSAYTMNPLHFGRSQEDKYYFNGLMDEAFFYNRALSEAEIKRLYLEAFTPTELLEQLIKTIVSLNLQEGISNALDAKLDSAVLALDDVNENNDIAAVNSINAFINAVEAQRGNKICSEDADILVAAAQAIIDKLQSQ